MKYFILITALLLVCASSQVSRSSENLSIAQSIIATYENGPVKELFKVFHFVFQKPYDLNSETAVKKYRVFKDNLKLINEHNAKNLSWWQGVNQFTDWTVEEFKAYNKMRAPQTPELNTLTNEFKTQKFLFELEDDDSSDLPNPKVDNTDPSQYANVDWTAYMPAVKDQQQCGCCYAYSTATLIEARANINNKTGRVPATSTQQIVDCSANYGNNGCNGGWQVYSLKYIAANNGVMNDSDYPFIGVQNSSCQFNINKVGPVKVKGFTSCDPYGFTRNNQCNTSNWYNFLASGPVAVVVDAYGAGLMTYAGGIINVSNVACGQLDHAVTVYKYTSSTSGTYLTVRNSWNTWWGEKGDFRIYLAPQNNMSTCWITKIGIIPTY